LVRHHGIISGAYLGLIPRRGNNPIYLLYVLYYWDVSKELYRYGSGLRQSLSWFDIKYLQIPIPPICEQEAIVEYLDNVIAEIDKAIEAKERIIAALEERRKIIITEAVTRGINPNVPLRESGIEWLGQIPAHWETIPVRHVFEFRNGYTPSKINPSFWSNGTIPWFRMEDIRKSGRKLERAIQYITPAALNNGGTFDAGSFIMAICTASIGEHAMLIADSLANQRFTGFQTVNRWSWLKAKYLLYRFYGLGDWCRKNVNAGGLAAVSITDLQKYDIDFPSTAEERDSIADYFDNIDKLLVDTEREITRLEKMKQASLQKMFPRPGETTPEIRFDGFDGEWRRCKLSELLTQRIEHQKISEDEPLLAFSYAEGVIDPEDKKSNKRDFLMTDKFNKIFSRTEVDDIIYNPANVIHGAIHRNTLKTGVVSPIYKIFSCSYNISPKYMGVRLRTPHFIAEILKYIEGTVIKLRTLSPESFLNMEI